MTLRNRVLPSVPAGVAMTAFSPNLKLYSDTEIHAIKKQLIQNGRYRYCVDERGLQQRLKYPIFVFNGKYFASYPGKLFLLGKSLRDKVKVVQDLDSGEWLAEKVILSATRSALDMEANVLNKMNQAVVVAGEAMTLFREQAACALKVDGHQQIFFGGNIDEEEVTLQVAPPDITNGKGYLFMRRAEGVPVTNIAAYAQNMSVMLKLYITIALVDAVNALHQRQWLHRNIQPEIFFVDIFKAVQDAVSMVGFSYAVQLNKNNDVMLASRGNSFHHAPEVKGGDIKSDGKYSFKSDIYALGATLRQLWDEFSGHALKSEMDVIINRMLAQEPSQRLELQAASELLKKLYGSLSVEERTVKIGTLDVAECYAAYEKGGDFLQTFISRLRPYTCINLFTANDALTDFDLLSIKKLLEAQHIIVSESVTVASYATMYDEVTIMNNQFEGHTLYRTDFITSVKRPVNSSELAHEVYIEFGVDDSESPSDGDALLGRTAAESYNLCECLSWFFVSIMQDLCRPVRARGTRFDIFSRAPSTDDLPTPSGSDTEHRPKML